MQRRACISGFDLQTWIGLFWCLERDFACVELWMEMGMEMRMEMGWRPWLGQLDPEILIRIPGCVSVVIDCFEGRLLDS